MSRSRNPGRGSLLRKLFARISGCAAVLALASCAGGPGASPRQPAAPPPPVRVADLELRALLLLQVDRQLYEPLSVEHSLQGPVALRRRLAQALGQAGSRRGRPVLEALLLDPQSDVRRTAAYSLGILGDPAAARALLRVAGGPDRHVAQAAVAGLALLGASVVDVGEVLAELGEEEFWSRLLPALHRFEGEAVQPLARRALAQTSEPELRRLAAHALARHATPEARQELRTLLASPEPWIRTQAARGLGSLVEPADLPLLRPLLDDPEQGPVLAVLQTVPERLAAGYAAAPQAWREPLLALLADRRPGVRLTAVEAASEWLLDDRLAAALITIAEAGEEPFASTAAVSLARGGDPRAVPLLARAAGSSRPRVRVQVAEGAAALELWSLVEQLAEDPSGVVRAAVVAMLLERHGPESRRSEEIARHGLLDRDGGVRDAVLAYLAVRPLLPVDELAAALDLARRDRIPRSEVDGIEAVVARAWAVPAEEPAAAQVLKRLAAGHDYRVRAQAAAALMLLGRPAPAVGTVETGRGARAYEQIVLQASRPRRVKVATERGALTFELACPEVPLSCVNFLQLARQGFFDGLGFHRLVPGQLAEGGDPRGDGLGGPGYTLRDEIRDEPFERGSLGMVRPGPHGAGSQFFIAFSRLPELDGRRTHLGRLIGGVEVLDRLLPGDIIEAVEVLD